MFEGSLILDGQSQQLVAPELIQSAKLAMSY
jgi:hypothetical protein